jgi:ketosteroid isomerase-like protein
MPKSFFRLFVLMLGLSVSAFCTAKKAGAKMADASAPDKAYLQKVLDGWSSLDPADARKFYAHGPGTFFDVTPLRYNSWEEYESGVRKLLTNYQSIKLTLNDDAAVHVHGDMAWAAATIKEDSVLHTGRHEMATMRWTVIFERQNGQWLIVHDHTSQPLQ